MALRLTIEFDTAVHHGSGFGVAGVIDRAVLRDENGMPYLAGSAIKGKFRFAASRWHRARGLPRCGPPGEPWCNGENACLLCRVFGSPRRPGLAVFEDAYPAPPADAMLRAILKPGRPAVHGGGCEIRSSTAIDRYSRRVRPQHLFSTEVVPPLVHFESSILGDLNEEQTGCVTAASKLLSYFGGDSSRGMGHCRYSIAVAQ
ncbi:MAG TPA: RAMP superfamily CRISPR-associated protein [Candidatus Saccharimonadales bacterium]|jgi:CRISPR/Cas system CSM-associated protein Csm3 (group 7 of RAMP superfamily)|nr:RAMP superfamily CRISPR-associated protein [Candidatus Saccharimonadales bacterium]